jgi:alkylation response protein AidB-like acyl-CoA dehydrogenase
LLSDPVRNGENHPMQFEPTESSEAAAVRAGAREWLEANWDPDLTLGQWWRLLADSGWGFPAWPQDWFGRDLDPQHVRVVASEVVRVGAAKPTYGIATMMAGPAILAHGTEEQKRRFLPPIVYGEDEWCQLFSEPGAGSDLAAIATRAERDGDEWVVTGQKVWTSSADDARWGFMLARTNPDVAKHKGITYFLLDMHQPGIEIRPLREMTGGVHFNEVFLDGARVPAANVLGDVDGGWGVAMTTLSHERQGMGAGGGDEIGGGQVTGVPDLTVRAGDVARNVQSFRGRRIAQGNGTMELVRRIVADRPLDADPVLRERVARLYSELEVARFTRIRNQAAKSLGRSPGPAASVGKLAMSRHAREIRDVLLALLGPDAMLAGDDAAYDGLALHAALFSPSLSIAGGTDEVQHNIVGERALGLPKEPDPTRGLAFKDLPR